MIDKKKLADYYRRALGVARYGWRIHKMVVPRSFSGASAWMEVGESG